MKKCFAALAAAYLALLAACAGLESSPSPAEDPPEPVYEEPDYQVETMTAQDHFTTGDGLELARYDYQLVTLSVPNLAALSPGAAEAAERNVDAFNERMLALMDSSMEWGRDLEEIANADFDTEGYRASYYDETTASVSFCGRVVSVRMDNASYTGGAHPNHYTSSCLFDLETGQFIDPTQIAEFPDSFQTGVAQLLLEKADAQGGKTYWPEYGEIIARWNEGCVLFDSQGMLVVYSPYELGPYSTGTVELRLGWEELAGLMDQEGLEQLGVHGTGERP